MTPSAISGIMRIITALLMTFIIAGCGDQTGKTVTDIDGNIYETVTIGNHVWMAGNLMVTRFSNGDPIPEVTEGEKWAGLESAARSSYENCAENGRLYGFLYNWFAVKDPRGIAPKGWHVATDEEWNELVNISGGETEAAKALKATDKWEDNAGDPEKSNGFNAPPSGARRDNDGKFVLLNQFARYWTATPASNGKAWGRAMEFYDNAVRRGEVGPKNGFAVRCVRD